MFSWKVLWSTVLILTVVLVWAVYPAATAATAFFGTGSDAFDPNRTSPPASAVGAAGPTAPSERFSTTAPCWMIGGWSPHPARPPTRPAPSAARSTVRRGAPRADTEAGTTRDRYSASVAGRDMHSSFTGASSSNIAERE